MGLENIESLNDNTELFIRLFKEGDCKKNADIEKMEKRAELRKERDAAKANQPLVDLAGDDGFLLVAAGLFM